MAQLARGVEDGVLATFDPAALVAGHPGPACLFDRMRRPVLANPLWRAIGLPDPAAPDRAAMPAGLAVELLAAARQQRIAVARFAHRPRLAVGGSGDAIPGLALEVTILPVSVDGAAAFLALGADQTMVEALRRALAESREFHRTLASCSADFIWQVDAAGAIDYVGPRGLLDHTADEMFGAQMERYVHEPEDGAANLVFHSREPVWEREMWLRDRNGLGHCFLMSSVPVRDENGRWAGARGIGRDVTEQRIREAELQKARQSQRMVNSVLHAMRSEIDPRAILEAAATVAADAARLDACLVLKLSGDGERAESWVAVTLPGEALKPGFADYTAEIAGQVRQGLRDGDRRLLRIGAGGGEFLVAPTVADGTVNGAVAFGRARTASGVAAWTVEEEYILRAMADQMGTALAQFDLVEGLRRAGAHSVG